MLFVSFYSFANQGFLKHQKESYYVKNRCDILMGKREYKLNDGKRVDCLTDKHAIEFDFAYKYYECIGQALYYGMITKKTQMCLNCYKI